MFRLRTERIEAGIKEQSGMPRINPQKNESKTSEPCHQRLHKLHKQQQGSVCIGGQCGDPCVIDRKAEARVAHREAEMQELNASMSNSRVLYIDETGVFNRGLEHMSRKHTQLDKYHRAHGMPLPNNSGI